MKKRVFDKQIISILREAGDFALNSAVSMLLQTLLSTHGARILAALKPPDVKRLKSFEKENALLKKLLAKAMLDKEALQIALGRKFGRQTRSGRGSHV